MTLLNKQTVREREVSHTEGVGGFVVFDHVQALDFMRRIDTKQFDGLHTLNIDSSERISGAD